MTTPSSSFLPKVPASLEADRLVVCPTVKGGTGVALPRTGAFWVCRDREDAACVRAASSLGPVGAPR